MNHTPQELKQHLESLDMPPGQRYIVREAIQQLQSMYDLIREMHRKLGDAQRKIESVIRIDSVDPFNDLSKRARHCLYAENIRTVEEVRAALARSRDGNELLKTPGLGRGTLAEIRKWLEALPPGV